MKKLLCIATLLFGINTAFATGDTTAGAPDTTNATEVQITTRVYDTEGTLHFEAADERPALPANSVLLFTYDGVSYYVLDELNEVDPDE
ncbi:MAG: hypothetical protein WBA12_08485 [Catalinimonas sp.]